MQNKYWQQKWQNGDIRFHQNQVHPALVRYFGAMKDSRVFVPLCGKTLDMIWLLEQGHQVIGAELSEIACRSFFEENQLDYSEQKLKTETGYSFKIFSSGQVTLWCGDFFELPKRILQGVNVIYDRAALIALPKEIRLRYASHICEFAQFCSQDLNYLLISLEYDQNQADSPPFSVDSGEIHLLFGQTFQVKSEDTLSSNALADHPKFLGIQALEKAYVMEKLVTHL